MRFRAETTADESPGVDLTPLIDVVFLLLIFFMVSSTFREETVLAVDLPKANSGAALNQPPPVEIVVTANGEYFVKGSALGPADVDTLLEALRAAAAQVDEPPRLLVSADRLASHESVIRVMEAARRGGFVNLGFTAARE